MREALTTSALLQLPRSMSRAAKEERVQNVLKELVRVKLLSAEIILMLPDFKMVVVSFGLL